MVYHRVFSNTRECSLQNLSRCTLGEMHIPDAAWHAWQFVKFVASPRLMAMRQFCFRVSTVHD